MQAQKQETLEDTVDAKSTKGQRPKLAGRIEINARRDQYSLTIDGEEFPWLIAEDCIIVGDPVDDLAQVTITIPALSFRLKA